MGKLRQKRVSIAVVGEGETEWYYIQYLKKQRNYRFRIAPTFPINSSYKAVFKKAAELVRNGVDIVFCIIDLDKIKRDHLIEKFRTDLYKLKPNIVVIASFPCIEAWFLFHFQKTGSARYYPDEASVEKELRKHIPTYEKSEKYLRAGTLYSLLDVQGSTDRAIQNSKHLLSLVSNSNLTDCTFSEIGLMIEFLDNCRDCCDMQNCSKCIANIKAKLKSNK